MRSDLPTVLRDPRKGAPAGPQLRASSLAGSETQGGWAGASGWGLWGPRGVFVGGSCMAHEPPTPGRGHRPCSTPPTGLGPGTEASAHTAPPHGQETRGLSGPTWSARRGRPQNGACSAMGVLASPPALPHPQVSHAVSKGPVLSPGPRRGTQGAPHRCPTQRVWRWPGRVEEVSSRGGRTWAGPRLPSGVWPSRQLTRHKAGRAQGSLCTAGPPQPPEAHRSPAEGPHVRAACGCQLERSVLPGGQDHGHLRSTAAHDNGLRTAIITWDTCQAPGP